METTAALSEGTTTVSETTPSERKSIIRKEM
jgi:hypothetical protein